MKEICIIADGTLLNFLDTRDPSGRWQGITDAQAVLTVSLCCWLMLLIYNFSTQTCQRFNLAWLPSICFCINRNTQNTNMCFVTAKFRRKSKFKYLLGKIKMFFHSVKVTKKKASNHAKYSITKLFLQSRYQLYENQLVVIGCHLWSACFANNKWHIIEGLR